MKKNIVKPEVSIVLFCYNQEDFIKDSLLSCLHQDYENLNIIISDDCSTDKTYEIIKNLLNDYVGKHKIKLNQNSKNLGIGPHFAYIMDHLVEGELVVMCAGDDISEHNRASKVVEEWLSNGKPSLVANNLKEIDENGIEIKDFRTMQYNLQDLSMHSNNMYSILEYLKYHQPIPFVGAAASYKIKTYKKFKTPEILPDYEDHLMYFRSLLDDGVHYINEKLVQYRKHGDSYMARESKPFKDNSSSLLSSYFDDKNSIKNKFRNCYQTHKTASQQWLDYRKAIDSYAFKVDYQLVESLLGNIILRHRYLIQNINYLERVKAYFYKNKFISKSFQRDKLTHIDPLQTVVFGTSYAAEKLISKTGKGFNIIAACNSMEPEMRGKKIKGKKIINLDDLKSMIDEIDCIIIASNKSYYQIKELILKECAISENRIVRAPALTLTSL